MSRGPRLVVATLLALTLIVAALPSLAATPPEPTYWIAVVDGDPGEWDLDDDFFADMHKAGNPDKPVLSKLYVRYDCATETGYVLVLPEPGIAIEAYHTGGEHYVKVDGNQLVSNLDGNDGTPPDFAYIGYFDPTPTNPPYEPPDATADGWEASFVLAPGNYNTLNVHTQVDDGSPNQTSAVEGRSINLVMGCELGSIGDYVWHDDNRDMEEDIGTEDPIPGVEVRLLMDLGSNNYQVIKTDVTDVNGYYLFSYLEAGDYIVDVNEQDLYPYFGGPFVLTTANEPYPYSLAAGEHHREADFGYDDDEGVVEVGDWVWYDINSNGAQDDGDPDEVGIRCVSVWLYDEGGSFMEATNTDSFGNYYFKSLDPNSADKHYTTLVYADDPDIEGFISAYNGSGFPTCSIDDGTPPASLTRVYSTGPTRQDAVELAAGGLDYTLDFPFSDAPLAVAMAQFEAVAEGNVVSVSWETVSEVDNVGFNLYRSDAAGAPSELLAFVPSAAPGGQGAFYRWQDAGVSAGNSYYYWLEDVDVTGATGLHGPVSVDLMAPTAVALSGLDASPAAVPAAAVPATAAGLVLLAGALAAWRRRR
ncbi:MAG: SdrD B-like domain-containing protein [Chloroflexota bacterium]|nr:SdrD B-like domain-containing protein [Chloroflexota bacterium]